MIIIAFDMGIRNFAFCAEYFHESELCSQKIIPKFNDLGTPSEDYQKSLEDIIYRNGQIIECQNIDLLKGENSFKNNIYLTLTHHLNRFTELWNATNVILIEQQMSYGKNKSNIQALRLAQHCISYFTTIYGPFKIIIEMSSNLKTRLLGCPLILRKQHKSRKTFAINLSSKILEQRRDKLLERFHQFPKKDDISDCLLMIQVYKINMHKTIGNVVNLSN